MKYFVYILKSSINNDIYIGSTENIEKRLKSHNLGKVKSTKGYRPWILLEVQKFETRIKAMMQEKFLKNHQQKEAIKRKYNLI